VVEPVTDTTAAESMQVPASREERRTFWLAARHAMLGVPRRRPLSRAELESEAGRLRVNLEAGEAYQGYAMVMLNNAFWLSQFAATPVAERVLLLPRCLAELGSVRTRAEALGYSQIHVAEGTPTAVKLLTEASASAILGVGCMDSLAKSFATVSQVGVPALGVPLTSCGCKETEVDTDLLFQLLAAHGAVAQETTRNYLPLLREARRLFQAPRFAALLGELPEAGSETVQLALAWMEQDGKRLRPFVTLASYSALAGGDSIPRAVQQTALAIEAFHKASLIHDDIEDGDETRYGEPTLHQRHGIPMGVNLGDCLLGIGYRLLAEAAGILGGERGVELLRLFSAAHVRLTVGQGEELAWSAGRSSGLSLDAVLHSYLGKTTPAFEAALLGGLIAADAQEAHREIARRFCKHLGCAFQIQNDLDGWRDDALRVRPTALMALALERCHAGEREALRHAPEPDAVDAIYARHEVCARARLLLSLCRERALALLPEAEPGPLRDLLQFLTEVLMR